MHRAAALIFMTGRNCDKYAARAVESISQQTLKDVHVLFVDDNSDDGTAEIASVALQEFFPGKHTFVSNNERFGKARNAWEHLRPLAENVDFIGVVDADDRLIDQEILALMAKSYSEAKDVVWTNFAMDNGHFGCNTVLDPNLSPRRQGWKTSHFFSFRAELLRNVPEDYFKDSFGNWLQAACDIALALPILDQTRRYHFIPRNAYMYTATNPQSHHNLDEASIGLNSTIQRKCASEIFQKTPLPLTRPLHPQEGASPKAPVSGTTTNHRDGQGQMTMTAYTQTWSDLTGQLILAETPGIINAMAYSGPIRFAPEQVWALKGILLTRQERANILHFGNTRSALTLAALVAGTMRRLTCVCASDIEANELELKLQLCGFAGEVTIVVAQPVDITSAQISGSFPDTRQLENDTVFDMVLIDLSRTVAPGTAIISLPALAQHLSPSGFAFCLVAGDPAVEAQAATHWRAIATGLRFGTNVVGGAGLLVVGGR